LQETALRFSLESNIHSHKVEQRANFLFLVLPSPSKKNLIMQYFLYKILKHATSNTEDLTEMTHDRFLRKALCEHGNKLSDSIKGGLFIAQISNY
jgi:hypothetical protein